MSKSENKQFSFRIETEIMNEFDKIMNSVEKGNRSKGIRKLIKYGIKHPEVVK